MKCPRCHEETGVDTKECRFCGMALSEPDEGERTTERADVLQEHKLCSYCSGEIRYEATVCKHCKASLTAPRNEREEGSVPCPLCREPVHPQAIICKHCHSEIGTGRGGNQRHAVSDPSAKEESRVAPKIAAILMIAMGVFDLLGAVSLLNGAGQYSSLESLYNTFGAGEALTNMMGTSSSSMYAMAGWNFVVGVVIVFIGIGLFQLRQVAYSWGVGTSVLNSLIAIYGIFADNNGAEIFSLMLYVIIVILLVVNKAQFGIEPRGALQGRQT